MSNPPYVPDGGGGGGPGGVAVTIDRCIIGLGDDFEGAVVENTLPAVVSSEREETLPAVVSSEREESTFGKITIALFFACILLW